MEGGSRQRNPPFRGPGAQVLANEDAGRLRRPALSNHPTKFIYRYHAQNYPNTILFFYFCYYHYFGYILLGNGRDNFIQNRGCFYRHHHTV